MRCFDLKLYFPFCLYSMLSTCVSFEKSCMVTLTVIQPIQQSTNQQLQTVHKTVRVFNRSQLVDRSKKPSITRLKQTQQEREEYLYYPKGSSIQCQWQWHNQSRWWAAVYRTSALTASRTCCERY